MVTNRLIDLQYNCIGFLVERLDMCSKQQKDNLNIKINYSKVNYSKISYDKTIFDIKCIFGHF